MANCVFVETGQCGNQLGYSLLDSLYTHLKGHDQQDGDEIGLETYFHMPQSSNQKPTARAVCLDTEPKVINENLTKSSKKKWRIDPKSVAYRHGGAGNNWSLGYQMASGEFLEISMNLIRRELERCDYSQALVFMHSVAGGTGSGLGTKISESCADAFPQATRLNIAIAPYHFGEVVVQHYNAILCLSKIAVASDAVLVFENEIAQMLCKTMKGVDRPTLDQLNQTIVSNLCPLFLPRYDAQSHGSASMYPNRRHSLISDVTHLCAHPGYKFLDVKLTPQTSNKSVDFTYDSWSTLLKTIQQMQLSGSASERNIKSYLKHALQTDATAPGGRTQHHSPNSPVLQNVNRTINHSTSMGGVSGTPPSRDTVFSSPAAKGSTQAGGYSYSTPPSGSFITSSSGGGGGSGAGSGGHSRSRQYGGGVTEPMGAAVDGGVVRSLASVITLHGAEAGEQAARLQDAYNTINHPSSTSSSAAVYFSQGSHHAIARSPGASSGRSPRSRAQIGAKQGAGKATSALQILQQQQQHAELQLHEMYVQSHSSLKSACGSSPVKICASEVSINGYQRATSVLSNCQAILPILQRATRGGVELFEAGAYLHQYSMYGIEEEDFHQAFRAVGCAIQNYIHL